MIWMETIRMSLGADSRDPKSRKVLKVLERELGRVDFLAWEIYTNPSVNEDCMLLLHWEGIQSRPLGSDVALALVRELKRHGLVDHTVWEGTRLKREKESSNKDV